MFTIEDFVTGKVKTLGWGVLQWCSKWLVIPDRDDKGGRWEFTTEQALFILNLYAVDKNGRRLFKHAQLSRPKGWGKSPVLAALCCVELLGPVRFSHWGADGNPVGKRVGSPYILLAAVTETQALETTMVLVREMLLAGKAADHYGLDVAITRVRAPGGGVIKVVPANPGAAEGPRPTFTVMDETHHWILPEAKQFAAAIRRNATKVGGITVESTNAPVPGQGSVAEDTDKLEKRIKNGEIDRSQLYDSTETEIEDIYDKEAAFAALRRCYGDSVWVPLDDVWEDINRASEHEARRFYFNQRVDTANVWLNPKAWEACQQDVRPLHEDDKIALGFRGQTRAGATSLVATRLEDSALFVLKVWETPMGDRTAEIDYVQVDDYIRETLAMYNVVLFFVAPQNWQDIAGRWHEAYEDVVEEFWTSTRLKMSRAVDEFEEAVYAKRIKHDGNNVLARHIGGCQIEELPGDLKLIVRGPNPAENYISAAEAAVLSFAAAQEAIERGLEDDGPTGYVYGF